MTLSGSFIYNAFIEAIRLANCNIETSHCDCCDQLSVFTESKVLPEHMALLIEFDTMLSLQPFQSDVKDYKPNVDDNGRLGAIFDKLINETEQNIATRPHYRSTDLDATKPLDRRTYEEPRFIEDRYTEADRQVDEVKKRYEHLLWLIKERLEDLELMLQFMERCGGVFDLLDWANKTEKNLDNVQPKSDNIEPLEREIEEFQNLCDDIASKKVPVSDNTVHAEQFLRNTKDKLTPELQLELQQNVGELRTTYERLLGRSLDWLKRAQDRLDKLKRDRDETVRLHNV